MRIPAALPSALAALGCILLAPVVSAKVPAPWNCEVPSVIVGCPSGTAMSSCSSSARRASTACQGVRVVVRDVNDSPAAFREVTLDFSNSSIRLVGDDRTGTTVNCAARTISRMTDAAGVATFAPRILGSSNGAMVTILSEGVPLAMIPALSTDLDGNGVTGIEDFTRVAANYLSNTMTPETDFDPCSAGSAGRTTLTDFTIFVQEYLRAMPDAACP